MHHPSDLFLNHKPIVVENKHERPSIIDFCHVDSDTIDLLQCSLLCQSTSSFFKQ